MARGELAKPKTRCIRYRVVACPLGWLLLAASERGVCQLRFGDSAPALARDLEAELPFAALRAGARDLDPWVERVQAYLREETASLELPLDVRGSRFQRRVWAAIREIPYGATRSYAELARAAGRPTAVRAVARACGANPVALLTPCHRVVASDGGLGGYRFGPERKRALLAAEPRAREPRLVAAAAGAESDALTSSG